MYKFFKMTALCAALAAAGAAGAATITLDGTSLSIEDAWKIAAGEADVAIAPEAVKLLEDSHKLVMASAAKGQAVYGLTVGVGLNKDQKLFTADGKLSPEVLEASRAFNYNALRSHSAGVGEMMPVDLARLSMVVRLNTLLAGKSGAQVRVAELYRDMLNKNVTPLIPSEGSVGEADILLASHVGAVMIGEWKADVKGKVMTGADALKAAGIKPLQPEGKDALAILSNNSVAMAYAIDAARNAERIVVVNDSHIAMDGTPPEVFSRAEELLAMGLDVPQITRLFLRLRELGMDVDPAVYTVEQAKRQLLGRKGGAAKC